jgi:hypothetical protein
MIGPVRTRPRKTRPTTDTSPYQAQVSVPTDSDLSNLRTHLLGLDETAAEAEVLGHMSAALSCEEDLDDYFIRLAQMFEDCKYGRNASFAGHKVCITFWERVIAAQAAMVKKKKLVESIEPVFPSHIFEYYGWYDLGQSALQSLKSIAKYCARFAPRDKKRAWRCAVKELNCEMLRRDKRTRLHRLERPYIGKLIGEHYISSKVQDAYSPFETQDFSSAWETIRKWPSGEEVHSEWDWKQQETMEYLRENNLGFDENGTIVPEGGRLDETLLKLYLPPMQKEITMTRHANRLQLSETDGPWDAEISLACKSLPKAAALATRPCSPEGDNHPHSSQNTENGISLNEQEREDGGTAPIDQSEALGDTEDMDDNRERSPGLSSHIFSNMYLRSSEQQESLSNGVVPVGDQVLPPSSSHHEDSGRPSRLDVQHKILEAVELVRTSYAHVDNTKGRKIESLLQTALALSVEGV